MDRNAINDLEAVAAVPGIEQLAVVVARNIQTGKGFAADPTLILILLAGRCHSIRQKSSPRPFARPAYERHTGPRRPGSARTTNPFSTFN